MLSGGQYEKVCFRSDWLWSNSRRRKHNGVFCSFGWCCFFFCKSEELRSISKCLCMIHFIERVVEKMDPSRWSQWGACRLKVLNLHVKATQPPLDRALWWIHLDGPNDWPWGLLSCFQPRIWIHLYISKWQTNNLFLICFSSSFLYMLFFQEIMFKLEVFFCLLVFLLLQVETVAQFGVVFLLFALGLEFSLTKVYCR